MIRKMAAVAAAGMIAGGLMLAGTAQADNEGDEGNGGQPECVDLNAASAEELAQLRHVNDAVTAEEIIDARPIETVGDLVDLPGIGGPVEGPAHHEPAKIAELVDGDVKVCGFTVTTMPAPTLEQPRACDDPGLLQIPDVEGVTYSYATGHEVAQETSVTVTSGFDRDSTVVADFRANFELPFVEEDDFGGWRDHIDYDAWQFVWPELTAEVAPQGCPGPPGPSGPPGSPGEPGGDGGGSGDGDGDQDKAGLPNTSGLSALPLFTIGGGLLLAAGVSAMVLARRRRTVTLD